MKCAIYCRLSKEDAVKGDAAKFPLESESVRNQRDLLMRYAEEKGWDVYKVYIDDDYSGADRCRPAFLQLLADAEAGRFSAVLCKTQSRFTRDMEMVERYIHDMFPRWGIRFVALLDYADTEVRGNKKARQINGLVNEWYLEDLSENIKAVLDNKRRRGEFIGSFPPYGYRKSDADRNYLVVDPEAAEVVRLIFSLASGGFGRRRIADTLNSMRIPNPTKYKTQKGSAYINGMEKSGSGLWNRTTIGRILRNEIYTGVMVQGKRRKLSYKHPQVVEVPADEWIRVEGTHEAIISREEFELVRLQLSQRRREGKTGDTHLLAGKVICSGCGSKMRKIANVCNGRKYEYLRCGRCKTSIKLDLLEDAISGRISRYVSQYCRQPEDRPANIAFGETAGVVDSLMDQMLERYRKGIRQCVKALEAVYVDLSIGLLTRDQSREVIESLLLKKEDLETRQREILAQMQKTVSSRCEDASENVPFFYDADGEQGHIRDDFMKKAAAVLVDRILVARKDTHTGEQKVSIRWSF